MAKKILSHSISCKCCNNDLILDDIITIKLNHYENTKLVECQLCLCQFWIDNNEFTKLIKTHKFKKENYLI